jgi:(p)ppGpp synthase/HD superfamily hydrolase
MRWSHESWEKAFGFAAQAHGSQLTPDGYPYIYHIGLVAFELLSGLGDDSGVDADFALQCALLHDVLEDTDVTYEDLTREFGRRVADGVLALTKNSQLEKGNRMADSLARIVAQPREVWMVKLADRISNMRKPPSSWTNEKITAYLDEARMIHQALGSADASLSVRLMKKIEEYARFIK